MGTEWEFKLRFPEKEIHKWADRYTSDKEEMRLENKIIENVTLKIKDRGFLTKKNLLEFSIWKSGSQTKHLVERNTDAYVRQVTSASLGASDERFRIEALTLLDGVGWPTASIILHICVPNSYPVIDFRALWSLNIGEDVNYDFQFWWAYTKHCRKMSKKLKVDMRTFDRALWQYSYEMKKIITPARPAP